MPETPGERTMRRWYEAKLAERLLQAGQMAKDRVLLRRGARKMQDGTLGTPGPSAEDDEMQIRVGDEINYHQPTTPPKKLAGTLAKAAMAAALLGSGAGIGAAVPWLLRTIPSQAVTPAAFVDTDTQYEARFEVE